MNRDFNEFQRRVYLGSIDELWMEHINRMTTLRDEVAFVGYAQKQPLQVYKERAYEIFMTLLGDISYKVVRALLSATPQTRVELSDVDLEAVKKALQLRQSTDQKQQFLDKLVSNIKQGKSVEEGIRVIQANDTEKLGAGNALPEKYTWVGRNDPCPCGSGKRFKHCHGIGKL